MLPVNVHMEWPAEQLSADSDAVDGSLARYTRLRDESWHKDP